ncbi:extracellular matrix protein fras1 [Plakobranchus ocellatus]|uniref:Extracellular matrix protein fras1 n=1 Tax=Plakobranchus ocellatus TaxID=259542 RepID=A0AAV4CN79_9GAST|nr:extracellular matrix protein fras1 [Plakobranchus ocellatus]
MRVDTLGSAMISQGDSISAADLAEGRVHFLHRAGLGRASYLSLRAFDGQLSSDILKLTVLVEPLVSLQVSMNKPLRARAGEDTQLTTNVLDLSSESSPGSVVITVMDGPISGYFHVRGNTEKASSFTLAQLKSGSVMYRHSGNNSTTDLARLLVVENVQQMSLLLSIRVQTRVSEAPVLVTNTGGHVVAGETLQITQDLLEAQVSAEDGGKDQDIIFTLVPRHGNPKHGEIIMMVPIPADGPGQGWRDQGDGMMSARLYRFMQRDIDQGRIYYRSLMDPTHGHADKLSDSLTFEISDTASPAHIARDQVFSIRVTQQNDVEPQSLPTLAPGVRLGMTVFENQIVPISSTHLAFADQDTPPSSIVYRVTSLLNEEEGSVEHRDFPFSPVLQFTQEDVDQGKILYRPPQQDIGTEELIVSFMFVVSDDGQERQLSEHKFTIRVIPVNNNPPVFLQPNPEVNMAEGGVFPLTPGILEVIDPDTDLTDLQVAVTVAPRHGLVQKMQDGITLQIREGDSFAYEDFVSSNLKYTHTGGIRPPTDQLSVTVSDGPHETMNTITFNILKVDKSAPTALSSASCSINVTEGETVTLTRDVMAYSDAEDGDDKILITLISPVTHGNLAVVRENAGGVRRRREDTVRVRRGGSFTQQDVNDGKVRFLSDQEIGSRAVTELVYVNVSDASGNVLPSQILAVVILPVDNLAPTVVLGPSLQVREGGEAELTSDLLSVMDVDTPLDRLTFNIDTQPVFGRLEMRKPGKFDYD